MTDQRRMNLPQIEPWPDYGERIDAETLQDIKDLAGASDEDLVLRQKELAVKFARFSLVGVAITADRIVDTCHMAQRDPELGFRQIEVYARAVLTALAGFQDSPDLVEPGRGISDPKPIDQKTPADIAFRLVKGVHVATNGFTNNLAQHGLAAEIDMPERYRNS